MIILGCDVAYKGGAAITDKAGLIDHCKWESPKKQGKPKKEIDDHTRRCQAYDVLSEMLARNKDIFSEDELKYAVISSSFFSKNVKVTINLARISQHFFTQLDESGFICCDMKDSEARKTLKLPFKKLPAQVAFRDKIYCPDLSEDEIDAFIFAEALRKELIENER